MEPQKKRQRKAAALKGTRAVCGVPRGFGSKVAKMAIRWATYSANDDSGTGRSGNTLPEGVRKAIQGVPEAFMLHRRGAPRKLRKR